MRRLFALACALLLWPCVADAAPKKLNQILITLDPEIDFESTRPGWATKIVTALGCEVQPKLANKPPLESAPFTLDEVIALAKKAKRLRQTTKNGKVFLFISLAATGANSAKAVPVEAYR